MTEVICRPDSIARRASPASAASRFYVVMIFTVIAIQMNAAEVDFARDIRPLLNKNCVSCHGGVKRAGKISFISRDLVIARNAEDEKPIHPGHPEDSELIRRVTTTNEDDRMPPPEHGSRLTDAEIKLLGDWIQQGANWTEHWAWNKPAPQTPPKVSKPKWCREPLDNFILARLEAEKLKASPEAERAQWLRRVTFDLIGLPPTPAEVREFLADKSPAAFEKVVDRLLASPRFGERWASPWLDLARYADSMGYEKDPLRTIWPYRDWVIRALNEDMPFDQFTIRQLAGDLLPDTKLPDLVASTFHRNTQINTEGGTDDEEFRIAAVVDRVNTTWETWQATTMRCVQCHSHPYEPINHDEYYRAFAIFNTSRDWDTKDDAPRILIPTAEKDLADAEQLPKAISRLRREEFSARENLFTNRADWLPLTPEVALASQNGKLVIQTNEVGSADIRPTGTIANYTYYCIELPIPAAATNLGALAIEVLPDNPAKAVLTPELGFVISNVRMMLVPPNATNESQAITPPGAAKSTNLLSGEIKLAHCFGDEAEPQVADDATVDADKPGWGADPRLTHPRRAVFVPETNTPVPAGSRLRVLIFHDDGPNDMPSLFTRRVRLAMTPNNGWIEFAATDAFKARRKKLGELRRRFNAIAGVRIPVMSEQEPAFRRDTATFIRGNWLDKGVPVHPGVPQLFSQLPANAPPDRLALSRWLVSPENPLTARVTVNRIWEQVFGIGIVETVEDFGTSGQPPSHPELLDFLALRFQNELGWSVKKLLREIVLSATYRQDAKATKALTERDPRNRLLARGPRVRLSAEMVRDSALAASGLLSEKMFGPPVMPYQPDGIWRAIYSKAEWKISPGEDAHRRAVYTFVRRTSGYPSTLTFDQPSREVCVSRRLRTNTPLQALVTLNDPVYVECAAALGNQMKRDGGNDLRRQIASGYQLVTGHAPSRAAIRTLAGLHKRSLDHYRKAPELVGQSGCTTPEDAALALVAKTILNLDESLTK